jgi:hypothetical protein
LRVDCFIVVLLTPTIYPRKTLEFAYIKTREKMPGL